MSRPFFFATGIENSYPIIGTGKRVDQMAKSAHYDRFREDFGLVKEMGINALRYGPPYYRVHRAPDQFDWSTADEPMHCLKELGIEVIADLCHFGVPDWLNGFQDPAFPVLFADYARAFARRFSWVRYYTPVNEIFICASFSALRGYWNECLASEEAFATAIRNLCMAHELAVEAILAERPDAIFVQGESIEHFHAANTRANDAAARENAFKHLALDLTTGSELGPGMAGFLNRNGVSSNDLSFFREKRAVGQRWLGLDYYVTCEHSIDDEGTRTRKRRGIGLSRLAAEYYARYRLPLFHCETNRETNLAVDWLHAQWNEILGIRAQGIPIHGFTWYSLTDQIDWQHALRVEHNDLHPVGLYDMNRRIRPVGRAYRKIITDYAPLMDTDSPLSSIPRRRAAR